MEGGQRREGMEGPPGADLIADAATDRDGATRFAALAGWPAGCHHVLDGVSRSTRDEMRSVLDSLHLLQTRPCYRAASFQPGLHRWTERRTRPRRPAVVGRGWLKDSPQRVCSCMVRIFGMKDAGTEVARQLKTRYSTRHNHHFDGCHAVSLRSTACSSAFASPGALPPCIFQNHHVVCA